MLDKLALPLAIAYTILITVLSLITVKDLPDLGTDMDDKILHVGAYFVLIIMWYFGLKQPRDMKSLLKIAVSCVLFGIVIEVIQGKVNINRAADFLDAVANFIGVILGFIALLWLRKGPKLKWG